MRLYLLLILYYLIVYRLAKNINVPVSRIQDIFHGKRKITPDTSLRLSKYFEVSERYFLDIQSEMDIRE
ncbi:MAG: HigA family addiction module antidote protein [Candidatus Riflebacteria bacterium]|nr:HigA family addiction module antidote protein [Candidatus Riflebacteria bacterium]